MDSVILDNVAAGVNRADILGSYPALPPVDIDAALFYAAELAREGTLDLPLEAGRSLRMPASITLDPDSVSMIACGFGRGN